MRRFLYLVAALLLIGLIVWAFVPPTDTPAPAAGMADIQVTAALVSPRDIVVDWNNPFAHAAGYILEWDVTPDGEFVPLGFFPPGRVTHKHPDLMWETPNYYRVRAYYGPASSEIEVTLPETLTNEEYRRRFDQPEDYMWAGPVIVPDSKPVEKKSIRDPATAAEAAPIDFKIELMPVTVSAFKLTWTDRASDEEGTMIELKKEGSSEFEVVALVEPNVNSFGWAFEPPTRKGILRVRPFYLGPPSKLVHLKTEKEPVETPAVPPSIAKPTT